MDTAKPLNPPKNDDAADDLIEELARLMADDAQLNSTAPKPDATVSAKQPTLSKATPPKATPPKATPPKATSPKATSPKATSQSANSAPKPDAGFKLKGFDLGQPKAEVSDIGSPSGKISTSDFGPASSAQNIKSSALSPASTSSEVSSAEVFSAEKKSSAPMDFDFGFGVGPDDNSGFSDAGAGAISSSPSLEDRLDSSAKPSPESKLSPESKSSMVPPGNDPIADLINAAVSKHTIPDVPPQGLSPRGASARKEPIMGSPARATEKDNFAMPPVFGMPGKLTSNKTASRKSAPNILGKAPASPAAGSTMDLDEIEGLIGNSVKVDDTGDFNAQQAVENPARGENLSRGEAPSRAENPARGDGLLSTSKPVIATSSNIAGQSQVGANNKDSDNISAEAAILQAMSASGTASIKTRAFAPPTPGPITTSDSAPSDSASNVSADAPGLSDDLLENPLRSDDDLQLAAGRVAFDEPASKGIARYVAPILGVLFIGAVGFGAYTLFNQGNGDGATPILQADGSPTRQAPDEVESATQSVVLNGIDGVSPVVEGEQLVSRDQSSGTNATTIRQVITLDTSEPGLANRRVRTVTVRPDGTIISGADAVAGGEVLQAAQPELPDLPAGAINAELSATTVASLPDVPAQGLNLTLDNVATPNPVVAPVPQPRITSRNTTNLVLRGAQGATTIIPQTTPGAASGAVNLIANAPTPPASVPVANTPATSTPVPAASVPVAASSNSLSQPVLNPGAFVQLSSQRDQGSADQTASTLQSRFASSLEGGRLVVRRVDLGTRGIYFRVQLPTTTLAQANSICESIKTAGGDCFVRNS